jgi:hypothetical protein
MPFVDKITINETSNSGPSGVFYKGHRYLSWRGTDDQVNVLRLAPNGGEDRKTTGERTISDPSLLIDDEKLYVSWTGTDKHLNVAEVRI